jgi:UDP-N-acetylmuramoyl-L-alanyl-D-glutamate--2,6-diaminopimelate ligase
MLKALVEKNGGSCDLQGPGPQISGVQLDSRAVVPGDLFVALKGVSGDGRTYVDQAIAGGASAVLWEEHLGAEPSASLTVPVWSHRDARQVAGLAAADVHGNPAHDLAVYGVTGTNGKTTVAHLIGDLLRGMGTKVGVIGTTGIQLASGVHYDATHTTPDAPSLQKLLAKHRTLGGEAVVLEVSSHALCQHRTSGLAIDFGIFTNLTREHLDYHGDMQQYAYAKSLMFSSLQSEAVAILNQDDPWWEMMAAAARENGARVVTYSAIPNSTKVQADLQASELSFDTDATYLTLSGMGISLARQRIPLSGRFNVSNLLAASAAVLMSGASPSAVVAGLASVSPPRGRLERVRRSGNYMVAPDGTRQLYQAAEESRDRVQAFVDYAHTPDALQNVLLALRELVEPNAGRVLCVFGCGGDRDPGKRPAMGQVATELADVVFVTSDNPRTEDPLKIIDDIREGIEMSANARFDPDRRQAIRAALAEAEDGDVVLVAGKGHEAVQVVGHERRAFDDRLVIQEEWS